MTDSDNNTTSADDQFPTDSSTVVGEQVGIGKTTRLIETMAAISDSDEIEPEFIDPKGTREGEENGG